MTRTLTFKIDGKRYVACVDDWTMEIKDLKRNQAVEGADYTEDGFWEICFELPNGNTMIVELEIDEDGRRTFNVIRAVEFDPNGIVENDYFVELTIK